MSKDDKQFNQTIHIQKNPNTFETVVTAFMDNPNLSWKAKGILYYLLSQSHNQKITIGDIVKHSKDGKTAVYSGLAELGQQGYYEKVPIRDKSGQRISHWESVVYELPKVATCEIVPSPLFSDFQEVENQHIGNLNVETQHLENRELNKPTDYR